MNQEEYLIYVANRNYNEFFNQGFATPGNNGPHGHIDTPVRNTSHYLIIYSYLYKRTKEDRYRVISQKFANYLVNMQLCSFSGAIQCMNNSKFDFLNGLIGQAWVIEALIYYHDVFNDNTCLQTAYKIYKTQIYDYDIHLWHRIELDGKDIGIDSTYNHNVWFAACAYKLGKLTGDKSIEAEVIDFLNHTNRDFITTRKGLLSHTVNIKDVKKQNRKKNIIKKMCFFIKFINRRKLDPHYIQYGYQIFDMYGFEILKLAIPDHPLFKSKKFLKAEKIACDLEWFNRKNRVRKKDFNVYGYGYNSPSFELPFVLHCCGKDSKTKNESAFKTNIELMYDNNTEMFTKNNFDVETWNARSYEIIRYLEAN